MRHGGTCIQFLEHDKRRPCSIRLRNRRIDDHAIIWDNRCASREKMRQSVGWRTGIEELYEAIDFSSMKYHSWEKCVCFTLSFWLHVMNPLASDFTVRLTASRAESCRRTSFRCSTLWTESSGTLFVSGRCSWIVIESWIIGWWLRSDLIDIWYNIRKTRLAWAADFDDQLNEEAERIYIVSRNIGRDDSPVAWHGYCDDCCSNQCKFVSQIDANYMDYELDWNISLILRRPPFANVTKIRAEWHRYSWSKWSCPEKEHQWQHRS